MKKQNIASDIAAWASLTTRAANKPMRTPSTPMSDADADALARELAEPGPGPYTGPIILEIDAALWVLRNYKTIADCGGVLARLSVLPGRVPESMRKYLIATRPILGELRLSRPAARQWRSENMPGRMKNGCVNIAEFFANGGNAGEPDPVLSVSMSESVPVGRSSEI